MEIRVVGDSSSSGIGLGTACYPYKLASSPQMRGRDNVSVVNYSVPGLTSADAARLCLSPSFGGRFDVLIVYLGNNEAACTVRKGAVTRTGTLLHRLRPRRARPLRPPHFRSQAWTFERIIPHLHPNAPGEFRLNLETMIGIARRAGASVILVNPVANAAFPAGLHAVNGIFFNHIGLADVVPALKATDEESRALVRTIRLRAEGRLDEARTCEAQLTATSGKLVAFVARHNAAVSSPDCCSAIRELRAIQSAYRYYEPIVLYNLARLYSRAGDHEASAACLEEAADKDQSTYRITKRYREIVGGFAGRDGVRVLDLDGVLDDTSFVDYCHPDDEGHCRIAAALIDLLPPGQGSARHEPRYEQKFPGANYFHAEEDLVDYYQIDGDVDEAKVRATLACLTSSTGPAATGDASILTQYLIQFLNSNDQHAAFNRELDLVGAHAPLSHEILNFPEYYLHRLLYNYGAVFEGARLARQMEAEEACASLLLGSADARRLILRHNTRSLEMAVDCRGEYEREIGLKLQGALDGAASTNTLSARIKTIRGWYTREAFRYGTQSRLSMLYDRWALERIAEAIAIAAVVAYERRAHDRLSYYGHALRELQQLDDVHARHAAIFQGHPHSFVAAAYEQDLAEVKSRAVQALHRLVA